MLVPSEKPRGKLAMAFIWVVRALICWVGFWVALALILASIELVLD